MSLLGTGVPPDPLPKDDPALEQLSDPREQYRWFVGYIVTECADVDYLASDVVEEFLGRPTSDGRRFWAGQGEQLADGIAQAAVSVAENHEGQSERLMVIAGRYKAMFQKRNLIVHGMYDGSTPSSHYLVKPNRVLRWSDSLDATRAELTRAELSDLVVEAVALKGALLWILNERRNPDGLSPYNTSKELL